MPIVLLTVKAKSSLTWRAQWFDLLVLEIMPCLDDADAVLVSMRG